MARLSDKVALVAGDARGIDVDVIQIEHIHGSCLD
jgi:hypothetical protein